MNRAGAIALGAAADVVAGAGLFAVITAGFALSFDAIRTVGQASRIREDWAWLLPAAVDGAMAVGTVTAVVVRRLHRSTVYPWTVVLVNAAISVVCNALHAYEGALLVLPAVVAMAVSAVPAVNLALSVHLLVVLVDTLADALTRPAEPVRLDSQRNETDVSAEAAETDGAMARSLVRQSAGVNRPRVVAAGSGPKTIVLRADRCGDGAGGEAAEENRSGLQSQRVVAMGATEPAPRWPVGERGGGWPGLWTERSLGPVCETGWRGGSSLNLTEESHVYSNVLSGRPAEPFCLSGRDPRNGSPRPCLCRHA